MKKTLIAVTLASCLALGMNAATRAQEGGASTEKPAASAVPNDALNALQPALNKKVDLEFIESPLKDVVAFLEDATDTEVAIDLRALEDIGLSNDAPITLNLKGVRLRSGLNLLLQPLGLTWTVRHEVLTITTTEESDAHLITRVYPVADMAARHESVLGDIGYDMDELIEVITATISPDTWEDVGGPAQINEIFGSLVISQGAKSHERIASLLQNIRRLKKSAKDAPAKAVPAIDLEDQATVERILKKMNESGTVEFIETPLKDVVDFLRQLSSLSIVINHTALEDVGIGADTPVTVNIKKKKLSSVMRRLLDPLDLTWVVRDEVVMITTKDEAESKPSIRLYPIYDLVGRDAQERTWSQADIRRVAEVLSTIEPESWPEFGGPGLLESLSQPATLVIGQTQETHEKVAKLLSSLRAARPVEPPRAEGARPRLRLVVYHFYKNPIAAEQLPEPVDGETAEALVKLLQKVIKSESWTDKDAEIHTLNHLIIVRQTDRVHRQIRAFAPWLGMTASEGALNFNNQGGRFGGGGGGGFFD